MSSLQRPRPGRGGFTIVELLVVVSIIAVLVALTTAAAMRLLGFGPTTATKSTLRTVKKQVDSQWNVVRGQADKEQIPPAAKAAILAQAGIVNASDIRVRATYVQLKLQQAFPQTFAEAINPTPLSPWPSYQQELVALGFPSGGNATTAPYEAAILLRMILEKGPGGSGLTPDALGPTGSKEFDLGNGQRARGLTDAWGEPLLFSRNPAGQLPLTLVILSAGPDKIAGVNLTDLSPLPPPPAPQKNPVADNLSTLMP